MPGSVRALSVRRVGVGVLLAVVGIGCVFVAPFFALLVGIVAFGSLYEFARLAQRKGVAFQLPVGLAAVTAYLTLTYVGRIHRYEGVVLAVTVIAALAGATLSARGNYLARSGYTLLGVFYIGKLLSYFIAIRAIGERGTALTVYAIVLIAMTDVAAMMIGMRYGRTPLTRLSPKKTVEGAIGGLVVTSLLGVAGAVLPAIELTWWQGLFVGLLTSIAAQAGDLVESGLKRDADVKDAGRAIAGHGGVLDRFDSFIFGGVAFYFALWIAGFFTPRLHELMHVSHGW